MGQGLIRYALIDTRTQKKLVGVFGYETSKSPILLKLGAEIERCIERKAKALGYEIILKRKD